jgi:hypothetical protein
LAAFLTGALSPESVAKALLYPRVLGTSITTSFGTNMQKFISDVLKSSFGSMVRGIDIEFVDALDGRKKYCQVKLGPNTINRDDVETIHRHFKDARNLGRTNNVKVAHGDLVVAILYGEPGQESGHYKRLRDELDYPLFIGQEFWHRLTGDPNFYAELRQAIAEVSTTLNEPGSKMNYLRDEPRFPEKTERPFISLPVNIGTGWLINKAVSRDPLRKARIRAFHSA